MMFIRHLASFLALPFVVTVVLPWMIVSRTGAGLVWPSSAIGSVTGLAVLAAGLLLFGASVYELATRGRGTLAPWDPPSIS